MAWLTRDDEVLAALGEGVRLVAHPKLLHTLRSGTGLDVAWCAKRAETLEVRHISELGARRIAAPHVRCQAAVVASPGTFERWRLQVGDVLTVAE